MCEKSKNTRLITHVVLWVISVW